jgi:hypothetical protein
MMIDATVAPKVGFVSPFGATACNVNHISAMMERMADNSYNQVAPAAAFHRQEQDWRRLLQQIVQKDQEALGTFYDATSSLVYGLALRILQDIPVAEEVTIAAIPMGGARLQATTHSIGSRQHGSSC